jgi:hypothetical protein
MKKKGCFIAIAFHLFQNTQLGCKIKSAGINKSSLHPERK